MAALTVPGDRPHRHLGSELQQLSSRHFLQESAAQNQRLNLT